MVVTLDAEDIKRAEESFQRAPEGLTNQVTTPSPSALQEVREALQLAQKGLHLFKREDFEVARKAFQQPSKVFEAYGLVEYLARCQMLEGVTLLLLEEWNGALDSLKRANKRRDSLSIEDQSIILFSLGTVLSRLGKDAEAVPHFRMGKELVHSAHLDPTRTFAPTMGEAFSLHCLGNSKEALELYESLSPVSSSVHPEILENYYVSWIHVLLQVGKTSIADLDIQQIEPLARKFIDAREEGQAKGFATKISNTLEMIRAASQEDPSARESLEEFLELVHLLSIKDPFERWEELGRLISPV